MQLLKFPNIQNKLNEYQLNIHKWNILFFRKLEMQLDHLLMSMLTNQVSHYLISTGTNVYSACVADAKRNAGPSQFGAGRRFSYSAKI